MEKPQPVTSGWRSTEFLVTLAAIIISSVAAAEVIPPSHPWGKVIAVLAAVLAALGYTNARTSLKKGPPQKKD